MSRVLGDANRLESKNLNWSAGREIQIQSMKGLLASNMGSGNAEIARLHGCRRYNEAGSLSREANFC